MARVHRLLPGTEFSGFRIHRLIGQGTMGAVYLAADPRSGVDVALKVMNADLLADAKASKRFAAEGQIAERVPSEHVVPVLHAGVDEPSGLPFIAMEYVDGVDLAAWLKDHDPPARADALAVVRGVLDALAAAHSVNVVHRDLKTENVMIARGEGGRPRVRVLDFGIAKIITGRTLQGTTSGLGTPVWTAPEQSDPAVPARPPADVWSLGLLAFEVFTGKSYWKSVANPKSSAYEVALEILKSPIAPASARAAEYDREDLLPPGFDAWFARCVARDAAARFSDAREAREAFEAMLAPAPALAATSPSRRLRWIAAGIALALIASAAIALRVMI